MHLVDHFLRFLLDPWYASKTSINLSPPRCQTWSLLRKERALPATAAPIVATPRNASSYFPSIRTFGLFCVAWRFLFGDGWTPQVERRSFQRCKTSSVGNETHDMYHYIISWGIIAYSRKCNANMAACSSPRPAWLSVTSLLISPFSSRLPGSSVWFEHRKGLSVALRCAMESENRFHWMAGYFAIVFALDFTCVASNWCQADLAGYAGCVLRSPPGPTICPMGRASEQLRVSWSVERSGECKTIQPWLLSLLAG